MKMKMKMKETRMVLSLKFIDGKRKQKKCSDFTSGGVCMCVNTFSKVTFLSETFYFRLEIKYLKKQKQTKLLIKVL